MQDFDPKYPNVFRCVTTGPRGERRHPYHTLSRPCPCFLTPQYFRLCVATGYRQTEINVYRANLSERVICDGTVSVCP